MSTYFNGANSSTYSSYYGFGGSITIGPDVTIGGTDSFAAIILNDEGTVDNLGTVEADSVGIDLASGGFVTNAVGGVINAPVGIYIGGGYGYVTNDGQIGDGTGDGVYFRTGGTVTNARSGTITGTIGVGVGPGPAGTVVNYGTIEGSLYSVYLASARDVLVLGYSDNEITFEGKIEGGHGTLLVGDGFHYITDLGSIGTLSDGASGSFSGFGVYIVESSANLILGGDNTIGPEQTLTNDGYITISKSLIVDHSVSGNGTIGIGAGATLSLADGITQQIDFGAANLLELADPAGVTSTLLNFSAGDTIDLTGVAYSTAEEVTYQPGGVTVTADGVTYGPGRLVLTDGTATVASFTLDGGEFPGTVFTVEPDGKQGTDIVIEKSVGNPGLHTGTLGLGQPILINEALQALSVYVSETEQVAHPGLNIFTPPFLTLEAAAATPVSGDVNIENGSPQFPEDTIQLGAHAQGAVLTGSFEVTLLGHTGPELLVGNDGNDTIKAGGGSGTIISGTGDNLIRTGTGDVVVSSAGDDTIYSGKRGTAAITALGSATVHAGGGFTSFTDSGTAGSADKVQGGSGTSVMNSGIGQDTFVGGSGTSFMNDTGPGRVALVFNKGAGGTDIVTGFDPGQGDYIRETAKSNGWADFQNNISVIGGSSFVHLADGTRIEFVGFTSLSAADFHG